MNEPENALFSDWVSNISEGNNKLDENKPNPKVTQYMAQSNLYSYLGNPHQDYTHRAFGF